MSTFNPIPIVPGSLAGQTVQLVDARLLHAFLGVGKDFTNWIKLRIRQYGFEQNRDYLTQTEEQFPFDSPKRANQTGRGGDRRSVDYLLTLDMAKELAMVERTPRGRQARRYFIDCERQLRQMRERGIGAAPISRETDYPLAIDLLSADAQAIKRQAWADVAGENFARFHARREVLWKQQRQLRQHAAQQGLAACADATGSQRSYVLLPPGFIPKWAQ